MSLPLVLTLAACSPPSGPREVTGPGASRPTGPAAPPFVVAEHAHRGGRLVLVDERGRRVRELTDAPSAASLDVQPAFSPDGRFVAFASSRGRAYPDTTSLWIVAVAGGAAVRLTEDDRATDLTPAFAPDGKSLAFASTRAGTLDLWLLALEPVGGGPPRAGRLERLTDAPGAEVAPAWSHDGARLAYVAADQPGDRQLMIVARAGGAPQRIAAGDTPAFAPGDAAIAYAARAPGREDRDLWLLSLAPGAEPQRLTDAPSDESAPRWAADGKFLFATSFLRHDDGRPLLSTVVFLELDDARAGLRALQEPIPTIRNGVDVAAVALDAAALRANPRYADAVRRAMIQ